MSPGVRSANDLERLGSGAGDVHLVSARAQERPHRALDSGLVVDEQNSRALSHHVR